MRISFYFRAIRRAVLPCCAAGLAACSIHPLPEDFSRASTFDIVERIRCEAQEGLRSFRRDDPDVQRIVKATTIGFDFSFAMTENNNASSGVLQFDRPSFKDPGKGFSLDLSASAARSRSNTRKFRIVETLTEIDQAKCLKSEGRRNLVYPIAGATGLGEVVSTYIRLELLTSFDDTPAGGVGTLHGKNVVFGDVLKFTTDLTAGATPTLTLTAVAGSLRLTNASFAASATRNDVHDVIVALASDETVDPPETSQILRSGRSFVRGELPPSASRSWFARVERREIVAEDVVPDSRSLTAIVQKDASARNRVLIELQRLRNLEDDDREAPRLLGERFLEIMRLP
jgi:hypothetical protein